MKILALKRYKGREPLSVLLDDEDYEVVAQHAWWCNIHGYIVGRLDGKELYLHRFLMGFPPQKVVDHINGNKLDNRRCNLRLCERKENCRNARRPKNNTSGCTGVSKCKNNLWRAYIMVDRKQINLGIYENIEDAIQARKRGERNYFGEFAYSGIDD